MNNLACAILRKEKKAEAKKRDLATEVIGIRRKEVKDENRRCRLATLSSMLKEEKKKKKTCCYIALPSTHTLAIHAGSNLCCDHKLYTQFQIACSIP